MRRQRGEGFGEAEIVGELRPVLLLALNHLAFHAAGAIHGFPELPHQVGVEGKPVDENSAGTVEGLLGVLKPGAHIDFGRRHGIAMGFGDEPVEQRLQAGLPGRIGLGLAALLVGKIQVFQTGLGVAGQNEGLQVVGELALLLDGGQNGLLPVRQLSEIRGTLLNGAQLGVIKTTGGFFSIPGNEGDGVSLGDKPKGRKNIGFGYV